MEISIESLMWVKQCHFSHPWLGMEFPYHLLYLKKKTWCLGDGLWHCFTNIKWYLIGGWATPLKNMSSSDLFIIPTIGENKKCSKPPIRYVHIYIYFIFIHPGANRIWTCQTRSLKWRYHWQSPSLSTSDFDFIQTGQELGEKKTTETG